MATWKDKINGNGLYFLARLTEKTGRYQITGYEHLEAAKAEGRPVILSAWHGMTMMLVGFFRRHYDMSRIVLIMPDDWRGAALEILASKLGSEPFPMNLKGDESMSAARTFARLVRKVKQGKDAYITPDGPEGPSYVIKPGTAFLAQKAKALIVPIGAYARHGFRLNRWDTYTIPYPYSRMSIHMEAPIEVSKGDSLTAVTEHLTNQLHRAAARARGNYYEMPQTS